MAKVGELFRTWGLSSIKLNVKFLELEFEPTEDDMTAAWDMYVELLTRITTQKLDEEDGDEKTALESVYELFPVTRQLLKEKGRRATNFTKIAVVVLNQIVRPFTAKWHRKEKEGAFNQKEECQQFRIELAELRDKLICYSKMLADMAKVEDLTAIEEE